jgi:hypothetical protein
MISLPNISNKKVREIFPDFGLLSGIKERKPPEQTVLYGPQTVRKYEQIRAARSLGKR